MSNDEQLENITNVTNGRYDDIDIKSVNDLVASDNGYSKLCFGVITDVHTYTDHFKLLAEFCKYGQADFVSCLGDLTGGTLPAYQNRPVFSATAKHLSQIKQPVLCVRGNHDVFSDITFTETEWFNRLVKPFRQNNIVVNSAEPEAGYYYKDFDEHKIRAVFTNSTRNSNGAQTHWGWDATQLQWIATTALDFSSKGEDKTNWHTVVFGHHATRADYTTILVSKYGDVLEKILFAFANGQTYTHSESGVSSDFSTQGKMVVIGYIFGHVHCDITDKPFDLNFPMMSVVCTEPNQESPLPSNGYSYSRAIGTNTEYAFDVFVIDKVNQTIAVKRCGAGENRSIAYKAIDYTVIDDFKRADSATTLGTTLTSQEWTAQSGTWGISSNQAYKPTQVDGDKDQAVVETGLADCIIECDIIYASGGSAGITFRNTDNLNFLHCVIDWNGMNIKKFVNGTATSLDTKSFVPVVGTLYHIKCTIQGDSFDVYCNDVRYCWGSSSFNNTATKHGLRSAQGTGCKYDNFTVIPIA